MAEGDPGARSVSENRLLQIMPILNEDYDSSPSAH